MSEESSKDCSAHGRMDQRIKGLEDRMSILESDKRDKNRSGWQIIVSISLALFSALLNIIMTYLHKG